MYQINESDSEDLRQFHRIAKIVFKRDGNQCESCFKTKYKLSQVGRHLTCHHIIPRDSGGTLDIENLITLCNKCHDAIEELALKTRPEIYGYFSGEKRHWYREENIGAKWQEWVYGGKHRDIK